MYRNDINKEALVKAFKKCVYALASDNKITNEEIDRTVKIALKELAKEIQLKNNNPQSYHSAIYQYEELLNIFTRRMVSRLDKSYNKELIRDTIKRDHLAEYPLKQATKMMGYFDEETVVSKIKSEEIKAVNKKKKGGTYDKYYISIDEIYKHKREREK